MRDVHELAVRNLLAPCLQPGSERPCFQLGVTGFDFLGYHFERGQRWPRKKSLMKLKERVRAKTSRRDGRSLSAIVADVNRSLRGWYQYFQHSKANTFTYVDGYVRRRLRSLLQWRMDGVGKGIGATHQRWPNAWFARCGLLSLAAEHE